MLIREVEVAGLARLAPMAGVTNAPFRLIARECGSGLTTSEEIDAVSLVRGSAVALDIARTHAAERPLAMQILGADADLLCRAAGLLQEAGAEIIDLNMGCPVRKIVRQGKGAALMQDVPAAARLLRALRRAVEVPLTIKIRGGWDDQHLNAVEVARMAEGEGVDAIVVHPRTRSQQFSGKAPWEIVREVVEAVAIPVTGNGDVTSLAEARSMMAETGCASVMIGRAALGRPWVFDEEMEGLSPARRWARQGCLVARHVQLMREHFAENPRYLLNQVRKHLGWYIANGLPISNPARAAVHGAQSADEALERFWTWRESVERLRSAGFGSPAPPGIQNVE
jgi:nifR3 family TIM-barrel protein